MEKPGVSFGGQNKRGRVESPERRRWSSYRYYLLGEAGWVQVNVGGGEISFRDQMAESVTQNLLLSALVIPALRTARRAGHPQSWLCRQDQRPGHPPIPTCTGTCTATGWTSNANSKGQCYSGTNAYLQCYDGTVDGNCFTYRAICNSQALPGICN